MYSGGGAKECLVSTYRVRLSYESVLKNKKCAEQTYSMPLLTRLIVALFRNMASILLHKEIGKYALIHNRICIYP